MSQSRFLNGMPYKLCTFCVMDTTAKEIIFDECGRCNFCRAAEIEVSKKYPKPKIEAGKDYDVLIGLSGGVDSSYALYLTQKNYPKARILAFTIDNGWNEPVADENIMKLVEGMKIPFYRYTINEKNFKNMQAAFMRAGVPNIEIPTDHILMAASYELASKYGIKTIVSGGNVATESIMPSSWGHNARDLTHIKAIYKGSYAGIPTCGLLKWNYYRWVKKIKTVYPLDCINYRRDHAIDVLYKKFGWVSYGEKHEESVFTKWFQNFYLYEKFGIDKRKAHYSSLIVSGQMTRACALEKLKESPIYPKLGIESRVLGYPKHLHEDYKTDRWYDRIAKIIRYAST